jgi:RNA 2',3'-cyclic 3'-phosphodiesterase
VRLFFALWPPAATVAALAVWAGKAQAATGGKPTPPEAIHLTLAFLGEVSENRIPDAMRAARGTRGAPHALPIELAKVWAHNSVVWVGPERTPAALDALARALRAQLQAEGFAIESRPFAAHVTLVRKAHRAPRLPPLPRLEWPVEEFTLVRSQLLPTGSSYEIIDRFGLAG